MSAKQLKITNVPVADFERGRAPSPLMYTNNLFLLWSRSQEDLWTDNSRNPWISDTLWSGSPTDHFCISSKHNQRNQKELQSDKLDNLKIITF